MLSSSSSSSALWKYSPPLHVRYLDQVDLRDRGHDARALQHPPDAERGELAAGEEHGDPAGQERRAQEQDGPLPPVVAAVVSGCERLFG